MVTLADSLVSSATRPLPVRMRRDLSIRRHRYQGQPYWVIKEPIGLKYYRFQDEEFAILKMLDGQTSYQQIKERFERQFAPQKITLHDLQHFLGMLHRSGLLVTSAPGQGRQLKRRRDETRRKELLGKVSNILALRFRGIDPEWILNRLYPVTRWCFTRTAFIIWLVVGISSLLLLGVNFDEFQRRLPAFHQFFGPENWIYLGITLALTKVLHEFGHGLSCKHFGGECHEMGVMFLVLTPCLYCNVSDSWLLPNKWHRAAIGAAGMYVEIFLASVATFLWWFSEPGLLNHVCLSIMFICSVSTVLFNGNPLLRFDGYYILSDIAEIPNLRQKSSKILQRFISQWCLGLEQHDDPFLPQRNHVFFASYTIAAVIYRWVVVFSIFLFLNKVLEPYGLKVIGQMIAFAGVFGLLVQPMWQLWKFVQVPGRMHQVKKKNVSITLAVAAACIAAFLFIPLPYSIKCGMQLEPERASTVYVQVPGQLRELLVKPGSEVVAGQPLARLENASLELEVARLKSEEKLLEEELAMRQRQAHNSAQWVVSIKEREEVLDGIKQQLQEKLRDLERLELKAGDSGTVLPPPTKRPQPAVDGYLPTWAGTPFDPENREAYFGIGDQFCRIAPDPKKYEATLFVDQADLRNVREGQEVRMRLDAYPGQTFHGTIKEISKVNLEVTPETASTATGGQVATRTDAAGRQRPLSAAYQARVPLEDPEGLFSPGLRGRAKIKSDPRSLGSRVWQFVTRTFHFDI